MWSGLEDGASQEVRLHFTTEGTYRLELHVGGGVASIPFDRETIEGVLQSTEVMAEASGWNCHIVPAEKTVGICLEGPAVISFVLSRAHLAALVKSLG